MSAAERAKALIDQARTAQAKAHAITAEWTGKEDQMPDDVKANRKAASEDALKFKDQADELITQAKADAALESSLAANEAWLGESRGVLGGMGKGGSKAAGEDDDKPGGAGRVQYKAADGEIKTYAPTGTAQWKAADEVVYTDVYRKYLTGGVRALSADERQIAERKALSVGSDISGGYLVASEVMYAGIIEALEDAVFMRKLGNVLPPFTSATSLKVATAGDLDDATWTTEILTGTDDTATPFGARTLTPHPLAKPVKVSNTLLRLSTLNVEAWVRGEIANRFAEAEENAFMTGTGAQQPQGVFVSSLPTDVTCTSSTTIAYADLVGVETALKSGYQAGASWIFHRTILGELNVILDSTGRPLLREIPNAGTAMSLFGYPINRSEYAPSSSASGLYVGALGNWKRAYWIVDTLNTTIQVVDQLYAATNQTGYFARKETDGMVVDGNGVIRLKMA